jgi:hypothetical protein
MVVALHRIVIMGSYPANQNLRQARQRAGISQAEFAERLGVYMRDHMSSNVSPSGNLVGMWERGEARPGRLYRRGLIEFTASAKLTSGSGPVCCSPVGIWASVDTLRGTRIRDTPFWFKTSYTTLVGITLSTDALGRTVMTRCDAARC